MFSREIKYRKLSTNRREHLFVRMVEYIFIRRERYIISRANETTGIRNRLVQYK